MNNVTVGNIRNTLDNQLDSVRELIRCFKYQEAAEYLSRAEEAFEELQGIVDLGNETHVEVT